MQLSRFRVVSQFETETLPGLGLYWASIVPLATI